MPPITITRTTTETDISLTLDLHGHGQARVKTGIGFLDHMLTLFASHGLFDLTVEAKGDLHVDEHHTVEDVGICLGRAIGRGLGSHSGIVRTAHSFVPMDEALAFVAIDRSMGQAGNGVAVIPLDLPGVSKGKPLNKLGQRDLNQGEIFFDNVRIPKHYMLVEPAGYLFTVDLILAGANAGMAATFTGVARAAFEEALRYSKERVQGGKLICEHQAVQMKLFDMFIKVEAGRALSRAAMIYNSTTLPPAVQYSVAAKVFCTEAAFTVASDAVQLFGGYGLSKELLVEKLFRDARASMIEDGCNDVLALAGVRQVIDKY